MCFKSILNLILSVLFAFSLHSVSAQSGTWEYIHTGNSCSSHGSSGSCMQGRHEASYVQVGDKFYLLGGRENNSNVNIYDPIKKIWTVGANAPMKIHHFQAVEYDGLILMAGAMTGDYPNETPIPNIIIYDPETNKWMTGPSIPSDRRRGSAGVVINNDKLYLVSGIQNGHRSGWVPWLDEYDLKTNKWRELKDAPHSRDHFHAALVDNKIVVGGGRRSGQDGTFDATEGAIDIYDLNSGNWSTSSNEIPTHRAAPCVGVIGDEVIYIGGEKNSGSANDETEAFNIKTGKWRSLDKLNTGRHGTQAIVNNENIWIASGSPNRGGGNVKSQERFYFNSPQSPSVYTVNRSQIESPDNLSIYQETTTVQIKNAGGNQAIMIEKISKSGSSSFSYSQDIDLPFLLKSGDSFPIQIKHSSGENTTGSITIEHTGSNSKNTINFDSEKPQIEPCNGTLTGIELYRNGSSLAALSQGQSVCHNLLDENQSSIRVNTSGSHQSVKFTVTTPNGTLNNTSNSSYESDRFWANSPGTYSITAQLYQEDNGQGLLCDELSLSFTVTDCTPPPPVVTTCDGSVVEWQINANQAGHSSFVDGQEFCVTDLEQAQSSIRVNVGGSHESLLFSIVTPSGSVINNTENYLPYDSYQFWANEEGVYTVTASLHNGASGSGDLCDDQTITFVVKDCSVTPPPPVSNVCDGSIVEWQINANGIEYITFEEGQEFCVSELQNAQSSIRTIVQGSHESLLFSIVTPSGSVINNTENYLPYDTYQFWANEEGVYTITATLHDGNNGNGDLCDDQTVTFVVKDCSTPLPPPTSSGGDDCLVEFDNESFESGWGIWNDAGDDSYRASDSAYAADGKYSIRIRDDSGHSSSMYTDDLDFSKVSKLQVDFSYFTRSVEVNEDFLFEVSTDGGSSWNLHRSWVVDEDFELEQFYDDQVIVEGPFSDKTRIRFRADASGNVDYFYIDNVTISICEEEAPTAAYENIAPLGHASQSSTSYGGNAARAIDKNISGAWSNGSVTHTSGGSQWWRVELPAIYEINRIVIYNRTDSCCVSRLTDFTVEVVDENGHITYSRYHGSDQIRPSLELTGFNARAKSVEVYIDGVLSLAEVQVYGRELENLQGDTEKYEYAFLNENEDYNSNATYATENGTDNVALEILDPGSTPIAPAVSQNPENTTSSRKSRTAKAYPNPANDIVNIDLSEYAGIEVEVLLHDLVGTMHQQKQLDKRHNSHIKFDVSDLRAGYYIVVLKTEGETFVVTKLLIQNGR